MPTFTENLTVVTAVVIILLAILKFTRYLIQKYEATNKDKFLCAKTCPLLDRSAMEKKIDDLKLILIASSQSISEKIYKLQSDSSVDHSQIQILILRLKEVADDIAKLQDLQTKYIKG